MTSPFSPKVISSTCIFKLAKTLSTLKTVEFLAAT